jgi:hypothetical protein
VVADRRRPEVEHRCRGPLTGSVDPLLEVAGIGDGCASKHATLVASTVDTVKFTTRPRSVEIRNFSSTAAIFYTVDGTVPTVNGDDTEQVRPNETLEVDMNNWVEPPQVQLSRRARRPTT